jgi:hypothetical protein
MKNTTRFIFAGMLIVLSFGCDGMAALFHGPKPEEPPVVWSVTCHANGAVGDAPVAKTANAGTVIVLPDSGALYNAEKTFIGWSTNAMGTGTTYAEGTGFTVDADRTLYARWITPGEVQQYTVTYNANGATGGQPPAQQTAYSGISITLQNQGTLSCTGKTFAGWNTAAGGLGTGYLAGASVTVTGNMELYAVWVDPSVRRWTVTFNANGASGTPPPAQTVSEGTSITLPDNGTLVFTNKVFTGWNTNSGGTGTGYAEGASYTVNANATFYAQWISKPIVPEGATLAQKLAYIAGRSDDGTVYDIEISENEYLEPTVISTMGRNVSITLHSQDSANMHTIELANAGHLFSINGSITLKIENIIL